MATVEATAALKVWGVEVTLNGKPYRIEPTPAAGWFLAIIGEEPLGIVPGMFSPEKQAEVCEEMALGMITLEEVVNASREALEAASGWSWWSADRMIRSCAAEWQLVSGQLIRRHIDLAALPLGAVLNALYAMAVETLDATKRAAFEMDLNRPPAGAMSEEERERIAEEMFMEALHAAQSGPARQG